MGNIADSNNLSGFKALVLCGGRPQMALIAELKRRGAQVIVADMNAKAPAVPFADTFYPVSTLDTQGIERIARQERADCVLSVCADQMLLVAAQVSHNLGLPCYIDLETAKRVSDKQLMKETFLAHGIPTAGYMVGASLRDQDIAALRYPVIVKPVDAYSSRGVVKVHNEAELRAAFEQAVHISRTGTAIVEEFLGGMELSVDVYVERGTAHILCIRRLDKIPSDERFIICRGVYPAPISQALRERTARVAQRVAEAFSLTDTPMLIQMKADGGQLHVIEFCARTGGGIKYRLLPKVSGFDVVKAVLDLTLGEKPHVTPCSYTGCVIDEFLYCKPGVLDHLEGFEALERDGVIDNFEQYKPPGYAFSSIASSGDRAAYFSIHADTWEQAVAYHRIAGGKVRAVGKDGEDLLRHDVIESLYNIPQNLQPKGNE